MQCISSGTENAMPVSCFKNAQAARIAEKESRLQHRGPPCPATASKQAAVILMPDAQSSFESGVVFRITDKNIPADTAAPQFPAIPQNPPGTSFPREITAFKAVFISTSPPEFLYAARRAAATKK